jgi:hypothetical protein
VVTALKTCPACRAGELTLINYGGRWAPANVLTCQVCGVKVPEPGGPGMRAAARLLRLNLAGRIVVTICCLLFALISAAIVVLAMIEVFR